MALDVDVGSMSEEWSSTWVCYRTGEIFLAVRIIVLLFFRLVRQRSGNPSSAFPSLSRKLLLNTVLGRVHCPVHDEQPSSSPFVQEWRKSDIL